MKSFKKFNDESLHEALNRSLARVHQHTQSRNIGIISANRGENTADENKAAHKQLAKDIKSAGYGFAHVSGRSREGEEVQSEPSFLVIGAKGKEDQLLHHLKKWGQKYNQDSILHKPHNSTEASLHGTSDNPESYPGPGKQEGVGKWHPNKVAQFFSALKGKRSFTFAEEVSDEPLVVYTLPASFFSRKETLF
jgi:hypothetical protein